MAEALIVDLGALTPPPSEVPIEILGGINVDALAQTAGALAVLTVMAHRTKLPKEVTLDHVDGVTQAAVRSGAAAIPDLVAILTGEGSSVPTERIEGHIERARRTGELLAACNLPAVMGPVNQVLGKISTEGAARDLPGEIRAALTSDEAVATSRKYLSAAEPTLAIAESGNPRQMLKGGFMNLAVGIREQANKNHGGSQGKISAEEAATAIYSVVSDTLSGKKSVGPLLDSIIETVTPTEHSPSPPQAGQDASSKSLALKPYETMKTGLEASSALLIEYLNSVVPLGQRDSGFVDRVRQSGLGVAGGIVGERNLEAVRKYVPQLLANLVLLMPEKGETVTTIRQQAHALLLPGQA